jgi:hypothetical protein
MGEMNPYKILVGRSEKKGPLGRIMRRYSPRLGVGAQG